MAESARVCPEAFALGIVLREGEEGHARLEPALELGGVRRAPMGGQGGAGLGLRGKGAGAEGPEGPGGQQGKPRFGVETASHSPKTGSHFRKSGRLTIAPDRK